MTGLLVVLVCGMVGGVAGAIFTGRVTRPAAGPGNPEVVGGPVRRSRRLRTVLRRVRGPERVTAAVLVAVFAILVMTVAAVGTVTTVAVNPSLAVWTDRPAASWFARHSSRSAPLLRLLTELGGTAVVAVLAVAVGAAAYRRSRRPAVFGLLAMTLAGQSLLVTLGKAMTDRARPDVLQLGEWGGSSFPSGHATAAAAAYACFAFLTGRGRSRRAQIALAAAAGAVTSVVAATRVALGVHWVTDAVAGMMLGWAWFGLCWLAVGGRALVFGAGIRSARRAAERS